ncbi:hypothetical protein DOTSEDRAFT_58497 [Dothistroma septosporum NZE10]|uniref:DUF7905 domain-containing protein n=1 Tax=Dothistroma septosporum (strain NZE10 / CBS 128990) TaxID=675120 RepID=N1Q0Q7_DOTSN|nr:hypothetical protein DOTSEDRAFT_58497 [Dothistroma septosporum NZE10]
MEDYELENARQWDDSLAGGPTSQSRPRSEWETVAGRGKQLREQTRPAPLKASLFNSNSHRRYTPARSSPRPSPRHDQQEHRPVVPGGSRQPAPRFSPQQRHPPRANRSQKRPQAPRLPIPRMVENADNEAQHAWRERRPPTDTVRIPTAMVHGDRFINDPPTYVQLAVDCGAFVYCDELKSENASLTFGIWGDPQAAAAAKHRILNWIEYAEPSSHKAPGSAQWSRIVSLTPRLRERAEKRWAREIEKNRYRQFPPNKPFGAIGTFHWPSKEFRPEEAFGMSCEAFDPIRMEYSCYITYNSEKSIFQIFGKDSNVQAALLCIRQTAFNICARAINPVRAYLLQWRTGPPPSHIYLEQYMGPRIVADQSDNQIAQKPSYSPRADGMLDDEGLVQLAQTRASVNTERVKVTISNALRKVHYLQGHLNLRIRLGTFLLSQYMELADSELWELADYESMVKATQFVGRITEELGGEYPENSVLPKLQRADDILSPQDAITEHLIDVRPSYAADFVFDNSKGDLCLRVTWLQSSDSETNELEFGEPTKEWICLDRDTGHATKLVDVSLTDPQNGSAWQFEMLSSEVVEHSKLPHELRRFANRIRIDPVALRKKANDQSFVVFNPFVQPKMVRQMIRYQYGIKGTDYTLELSQFQDRIYAARKSVADNVVPTVYEPRWGLNVFRIEWDTMFTKNARLTIGASADWGDDMENWFPQDWDPDVDDVGGHDGFGQLLRKLMKIEKLVREPPLE